MLNFRTVHEDDIETIVSFPQNRRELFHIFPAASYPLTVEQLQNAIRKRFESTVILDGDEVVGFANFYSLQQGLSCAIGNVIVKPNRRGGGIGGFLIRTMVNIGFEKYSVESVHISCFCDNFAGILLYTKIGFAPLSIDSANDPDGRVIPKVNFRLERSAWRDNFGKRK